MSLKRTHVLIWPVLALLLVSVGLLSQRPAPALAAPLPPVAITNCSNDSQLRTALTTAPAGSTIIFTCTGTIPITSTLTPVPNNLTLVGNGAVTLDGQNRVEVFSVPSGITFTLRAITIAHGSTTKLGGGLINNGGTVTIQGSAFTNNTGANGGGVSNLGTMTITDSFITNNTTTGIGGGGVLNLGKMTIQSSIFINNTAPINGGGLNNQLSGTVTITGSFITNNTSGSPGGGVSNLGIMSIQSSFITNNTGSSGGGIATANDKVTVSHSVVINNHPNDCYGRPTDGGGNTPGDGTCGFASPKQVPLVQPLSGPVNEKQK